VKQEVVQNTIIILYKPSSFPAAQPAGCIHCCMCWNLDYFLCLTD